MGAAMVVAGGAVWVSEPWLHRRGADLRFRMRRANYVEIATSVARDPAVRVGERSARGIEHLVDAGPPVRVAFPEPGGLLDNWCAVIYDATGSLGAVDASVSAIFGGDLVGCRRLDAVFFRCCFT